MYGATFDNTCRPPTQLLHRKQLRLATWTMPARLLLGSAVQASPCRVAVLATRQPAHKEVQVTEEKRNFYVPAWLVAVLALAQLQAAE